MRHVLPEIERLVGGDVHNNCPMGGLRSLFTFTLSKYEEKF